MREDLLVDLVEALFDLVDEREVAIDKRVQYLIEDEVDAALHHAHVLRQAVPHRVDGVERLFMNRKEEVLAEEAGQFFGLDAMRGDVQRDRSEDEKVVSFK